MMGNNYNWIKKDEIDSFKELFGLTKTQVDVLSVLRMDMTTPAAVVAESLERDRTTVIKSLSFLKEKGLVSSRKVILTRGYRFEWYINENFVNIFEKAVATDIEYRHALLSRVKERFSQK